MKTTFNYPTPQERLQVLRNYGEPHDRLVRERSVSTSHRYLVQRPGNWSKSVSFRCVSLLG